MPQPPDKIQGAQSGALPERVMALLKFLRCEVREGRIIEITDKRFAFGDRYWTIETASSIYKVELYTVEKYEGRPRLARLPAWKMFAAWEANQAYAFSELAAELLRRERTARPFRVMAPGKMLESVERIRRVRNSLTPEEKQKLDLMTPSEQQEYYFSHPLWDVKPATERGGGDDKV